MECEVPSKNIGKCNDRIRDDEINRAYSIWLGEHQGEY